jgi:hypothetical protein
MLAGLKIVRFLEKISFNVNQTNQLKIFQNDQELYFREQT